jgi:hypothetical protein
MSDAYCFRAFGSGIVYRDHEGYLRYVDDRRALKVIEPTPTKATRKLEGK